MAHEQEALAGATDALSPYWETLAEGQQIHSPGMTITDAHLVTWAGLTGDVVSLHLDEEYAKGTAFGTRIAHGPLTMSLALGLMTQTGRLSKVVAWLGVDDVRALAPVFIGDSIRAIATVSTARETSNPRKGLWTLDYSVAKQGGQEVMTFRSSFLIERRPS